MPFGHKENEILILALIHSIFEHMKDTILTISIHLHLKTIFLEIFFVRRAMARRIWYVF